MLRKIMPLFRDVLDEVHTLTRGLHFTTHNPQHLLAGALLGRVLEEVEGIHALLERHDGANAFILLRSLLEGYVDLRNISKDPGYADFMRVAFLDQQNKLLRAASEQGIDNNFLAEIYRSSEFDDRRADVSSQLEELRQRNISPLQVKQRFERAGQLSYYHGPYAYLCWHSHNNINVLEGRNLRVVNGAYEIRAFEAISQSDAQLISDTAAGIAANSIVDVGNLLGSEITLDRLTEKLAKFRELWQQSAGE